MNRLSLRHIAAIVALVITLIANGLSQSGTIIANTVQQVANLYPIFFLPANYVFGIWGLIYTGLIAYVIFQALPAQRSNSDLESIGWIFVVSCLANILWLVLFLSLQFWLSTVAMLILLGCLIAIYQRLQIGRKAVPNGMRWFVHLPFSIYLGWISVATIANFTYALYDAGWNGFGIAGETWAALMMVIAGVLAVVMLLRFRDVAFALVVVWALVGIASRYSTINAVVVPALAVSTVLVLAVLASIIRRPTNPVRRALT